MPDRLATPEDVGKPCPYCRFPLKEGAPVHACDSCGSVHHAECWSDGGGCAVFGCAAAGTAAAAAQPVAAAPPTQAYVPTAYQQAAPQQPPPGYAPPPPPPPYQDPYQQPYQQQPPQNGGTRPMTIALAALVIVLGIAAGVAVASGAFSSSNHPTTVVTVKEPVHASNTAGSMSPAEEQSKRQAIAGVLGSYQTDYSNHNLSGLGSIFAEGIKRHGLAANGCSEVQGKQAVLEDYEQQFNEGSGTYTLIGFSPNQVQLHGPNNAEVHSHYEISPGGAGFVNFKFATAGPEWKISEVYATCE